MIGGKLTYLHKGRINERKRFKGCVVSSKKIWFWVGTPCKVARLDSIVALYLSYYNWEQYIVEVP